MTKESMLSIPTLDLVVERFEIDAQGEFVNKHDALRRAAAAAERILYHDIYGALVLDLSRFRGSQSLTAYPLPNEQDDSIACFRPNWHIPPYEYESGIRWKPYDKMQQFEVKVDTRMKDEKYQGIVNLVAYAWDDHATIGEDRLGFLIDIVNRNRSHILLAETARVAIPTDRNSKDRIDYASLFMYGNREDIGGFEFPPDEIGDVSHRPILFTPIDLEKRQQEGQFRDR